MPRKLRSIVVVFLSVATPLIAATAGLAQDPTKSDSKSSNPTADFDKSIAPLLARRCLDCHRGAEPKGGLDLSRAETAMKGGESGKALVPGNIESSLLWQRIEDDEMPPKKPLPQSLKCSKGSFLPMELEASRD